MRLTQDEHHRQLVQLHDEKDEFYFIRLAVLFELNAAHLIEVYNDARAAGYPKSDARTLVLVLAELLPYERFLECYVLSGTTKFRLPATTGADSSAGSVRVPEDLSTIPMEKIGDGIASIVHVSTEKTD